MSSEFEHVESFCVVNGQIYTEWNIILFSSYFKDSLDSLIHRLLKAHICNNFILDVCLS